MADKANPKGLTKKIKALEKRAAQISLGLQNLKESEDKYRQIINTLPVAIFEFDFKSLKFTDANDIMCEYSGYTKEELHTM
ncbi:MAG: PAS domain S-box protein, partial [Deltaproteobacteria bacterium]|nr:PAS domain S-box protein [Deltaproteobacteria bacterium]